MHPEEILVIGGVAAGASFSARARRLSETARITVLERGQDVSFANCGLPYHIGGEIPQRESLAVQTPASLKSLLNIEVRTQCEAIRIDREGHCVQVLNRSNGTREWLHYDKLMLAPGALPRVPNLPGIHHPRILTLRNLRDMDLIIRASDKAKNALVIGAGFVGIETAEQLQRKGLRVDLVERCAHVLPQLDQTMTQQLENELVKNGVQLHLSTQVMRFSETDGRIVVQLDSGWMLETDLVVLSIGIQPETHLAEQAALSIGKQGHIRVNHFMQTSDPDIYAAGDAVETTDRVLGTPSHVALGGPANRQGRVAADHIFLGPRARPYPGSMGTAIVRSFSVTAGIAGASEQRLRAADIAYATVTVNDYQHASYFPGAAPLMLKLLWAPETGEVLGAQVSGRDGVDKRLDVLSTAIAGNMTIEDLCHLELAYAPPYGSAKDIVNLAGFAACNLQDGLVKQAKALPNAEVAQLLDVRPRTLAEAYPVNSAAINIPFSELRNNLALLDKSKPVVTICALGKTSYFAARVLQQHGFSVQSFSGGIRANLNPDLPTKL